MLSDSIKNSIIHAVYLAEIVHFHHSSLHAQISLDNASPDAYSSIIDETVDFSVVRETNEIFDLNRRITTKKKEVPII